MVKCDSFFLTDRLRRRFLQSSVCKTQPHSRAFLSNHWVERPTQVQGGGVAVAIGAHVWNLQLALREAIARADATIVSELVCIFNNVSIFNSNVSSSTSANGFLSFDLCCICNPFYSPRHIHARAGSTTPSTQSPSSGSNVMLSFCCLPRHSISNCSRQ